VQAFTSLPVGIWCQLATITKPTNKLKIKTYKKSKKKSTNKVKEK